VNRRSCNATAEPMLPGRTGWSMHQTAISHRLLSPIDLGIVAIYFVIVFTIGFYFSRKERTSTDYFLQETASPGE
jgi:hypothetical protein